MNTALALLLACLLQPLAVAAQEIGALTLVEGPLRVIRGTSVLRGAEGVRLRRGDIIESSNPGFVQLELAGGTVVALGASTRLFLFGHPSKVTTTELVLLSGWLKGESGPSAGTCRYASPLLAASTKDGSVVLHATNDATDIFVESGSASIGKVGPEGNLGTPGGATAGQFFVRHASQSINIYPRPTSAFVEAMPRQFRDTLPPRLSRFAGKLTELKRDHEVSYSEIQAWLTIGQAWRKGFVERFQPRLDDAEFRKALEAHLSDHPEWDPILHPDNGRPRPDSEHGR